MKLSPQQIRPGDVLDWPHPHTVVSVELLATRPDPLPDSYLITWAQSEWDGSRGLQCSADDKLPIKRSNFTDNADDRTRFGAGRKVAVIVNNSSRERHGHTGVIHHEIRDSQITRSWRAWVMEWDDGHYPSSEALTDLAPAATPENR